MKNMIYGLIFGLIYALFDLVTLVMSGSDWTVASAALVLRFSIGFLIFTVCLPVARWMSGLGIALVLTLPFAILTGEYLQFLGTAAIGGLIIGFLADRFAKPCYEKAMA